MCLSDQERLDEMTKSARQLAEAVNTYSWGTEDEQKKFIVEFNDAVSGQWSATHPDYEVDYKRRVEAVIDALTGKGIVARAKRVFKRSKHKTNASSSKPTRSRRTAKK